MLQKAEIGPSRSSRSKRVKALQKVAHAESRNSRAKYVAQAVASGSKRLESRSTAPESQNIWPRHSSKQVIDMHQVTGNAMGSDLISH